MLQNSSEFNSVGPGMGYGGFGGGLGGIAPFGLFGLLGLGNRGGLFGGEEGHRRDGGGDSCAREAALLAAIGNAKDVSVAEARALGAAICDSEKTNLQQFYAAAIQASNDTQAIKDQGIALAIANNQNITELKEAGVAQTAAILARINDAEVQRLRDELEMTRRRVESREVEINIVNSATATAQQFQIQSQKQMADNFDLHRRLDGLFSQVAKSGQDIINVGGILAGVSQAANPTNVNSKS